MAVSPRPLSHAANHAASRRSVGALIGAFGLADFLIAVGVVAFGLAGFEPFFIAVGVAGAASVAEADAAAAMLVHVDGAYVGRSNTDDCIEPSTLRVCERCNEHMLTHANMHLWIHGEVGNTHG